MIKLLLLKSFFFSLLLISFPKAHASSQTLLDSSRVDSLLTIKTFSISKDTSSITKKINFPKTSSLYTKKLALTDTILPTDSLKKLPPSDIKTTVSYTSKDSIVINVLKKTMKFYGEATVDYSPIALDAQKISINWEENYIRAKGVSDSTGKVYGKPVFKNKEEVYETDEISYNFISEKAFITGLITTQGDAFIHADKVYKNKKNELFNQTTLYTTCNLTHPHYSIKARKVKIIPNKEMLSGPFNMIINNVPTPIGFAFGFFPDQQRRTSGIIFPDFGEEAIRGFYLKNGGYYFALNDYINLDITGDLYTKGGWAIRANSTYYVRYKFRGNFNATFSKFKKEDENSLKDNHSNDFRLVWTLSPETKGTGRFSASVNYATNSYNKNNIYANQNDQIRTTLSSSVSYSKTFEGTPFSLGVSGRFNQNLKTKQADLLLPEISFKSQNIYPFKKKSGGGNNWYEKINFGYSMTITNKVTNRLSVPLTTQEIVDEEGKIIREKEQTVVDSIFEINSQTIPFLMQQGSNGVKHSIPLAVSFKMFKHFTFTPSFSYNEIWYFKEMNHTYSELQKKIVVDTIEKFSPIRSYSAGASINTRLYGTVIFNKARGVKAIRHMMTPSISYSYRPNFGEEAYGYYQTIQKDSLGNMETFSKYTGFVYGEGPGSGESSNISLGITNTLEMKYLSKKDTVGKAKKIALIRNFSISSSYNLVAEEFKLSPISIRATTNLLNNKRLGKSSIKTSGLSINFNGSIDPYIWQLDSTVNEGVEERIYQVKLDQLALSKGMGLGQLSQYTISINTGLQGVKGNKVKSGGGKRETILAGSPKEEMELREFTNNPDLYVDFNIPWSIKLAYNISYSKRGFYEEKIVQSLRFNGDISITEKWKLTYQSGYDFTNKKFTEARFNIIRDLHCWDMSLSWIPFGRSQSYNFTIKAKSSLLQDLKLFKKKNASERFRF